MNQLTLEKNEVPDVATEYLDDAHKQFAVVVDDRPAPDRPTAEVECDFINALTKSAKPGTQDNEPFEPEFDGVQKNDSWALLGLFRNSLDF